MIGLRAAWTAHYERHMLRHIKELDNVIYCVNFLKKFNFFSVTFSVLSGGMLSGSSLLYFSLRDNIMCGMRAARLVGRSNGNWGEGSLQKVNLE